MYKRQVELRADDAQAAGVIGMARADLMLLGHVVELDPRAVRAADDALGPEDLTVLAGVQRRQDALDVRLREGLGRLAAPGGEHLVGVVVMMVVAGALGIVALAVVMMVVAVVVLVLIMVMVMMLVVVLILVLIVVMVFVIVVILVMVVMMMLVAVVILIMVMMMAVSYTHLTV